MISFKILKKWDVSLFFNSSYKLADALPNYLLAIPPVVS